MSVLESLGFAAEELDRADDALRAAAYGGDPLPHEVAIVALLWRIEKLQGQIDALQSPTDGDDE
jgi:hypothetical protein